MYKIIGANQVEYGPVTAEQLRQWIIEGRVNAQTMAQAAGETTWKPISSFPEFAASFPAASAAPLAGAPITPVTPAPMNPEAGRALALDQVSGPAIGLIVTGGLGIGTALLSIMGNLIGMVKGNHGRTLPFPNQNPELMRMINTFSGTAGIFLNLIAVAVCIFVIFSGIKMKRLESHGMCMAASILVIVPFCSPCCCIGIPFGIWALVVLSKPEVKTYFN